MYEATNIRISSSCSDSLESTILCDNFIFTLSSPSTCLKKLIGCTLGAEAEMKEQLAADALRNNSLPPVPHRWIGLDQCTKVTTDILDMVSESSYGEEEVRRMATEVAVSGMETGYNTLKDQMQSAYVFTLQELGNMPPSPCLIPLNSATSSFYHTRTGLCKPTNAPHLKGRMRFGTNSFEKSFSKWRL